VSQNFVPYVYGRTQAVFRIRLLRKTFRPKGHQVTGDWKQNCLLRSFMNSTAHRYFLADRIKENKMAEAWGKYEE